MKKKLVSAMLVAAMAVSMLAGCGSSASSSDSTGTSANSSSDAKEDVASTEGLASTSDGTTLRINLASEPDKLDPALNSSVDGAALAANSFVGLFVFDENSEVQPALCDSYTVSEDGLTYVFTLKDGLKWSDGTKVFNGKPFYCFTLVFPSRARNYYCSSKEICDNFIKYLKQSFGYLNFFDYYEMLEVLGEGIFGVVKL